jgi:hypothetical protein
VSSDLHSPTCRVSGTLTQLHTHDATNTILVLFLSLHCYCLEHLAGPQSFLQHNTSSRHLEDCCWSLLALWAFRSKKLERRQAIQNWVASGNTIV